MHLRVTRISQLLAVALFAFGFAGSASAQDSGDPLGDDFIFFVDGVNVQVPSFDGSIADDPLAADNKVMQYNYGDWSYQAFRFSDNGTDITANRDAGDVFHMRLLVDPENQGKSGLGILFEDVNDGNGANDGSADLPFRLIWQIPEHYRDGQWHDLSIPLPPATWAELDAAKNDSTLDSLATYWTFAGAWSSGGFGVAQDGMGPNSPQEPQLWKEFEFNRLHGIGAFFDSNGGGGPIFLDDVYIGAANLDLSAATGAPEAMAGVSFAADGPENLISWTHNPDFGGYNVYFSENPITDIEADGVALLATVPFSADAFEVRHRFESPHPSLTPEVYYAVTSTSSFGVVNPDVSNSAGSIDNPDVKIAPNIIQLTEDEGNALFDALAAGEASPTGFPENTIPFIMDDTQWQTGENLALPESNDDLSVKLWMGYTDLNELWIYAEVTDDVIELAGENLFPGEAWQFDSIEIGWGNYDVRDVGGSILTGSSHTEMERGDFADYQFRMSAHANTAGEVVLTHAYVGWSIEDDAQGGGASYELLTDDAGNTIGYKMLALFPLDQIQRLDNGADTPPDAILDPPGADDIRVIPMIIAMNDADGTTRESQVVSSLKNNVTNNWWNTPAQWQSIAMAGRNQAIFASGVSNEEDRTLPTEFALSQNYPNPFNPSTTIRFSLANSEAVSLRVYDVLGREVATLIDAETMTSGAHSVQFDATDLASGMYLYRLEAGSNFVQTKQMMLLK